MKRTIRNIIIHCAATPNGQAFTIEQIDSMHKARGFKRDSQAVRNFNQELRYVGYHFVIEKDGAIRTGRGLEETGAHVQGHNANTIGICMIGTDKFTKEQWESLRLLIIRIAGLIKNKLFMSAEAALDAYSEMKISIKGHRDFSPDKNADGKITSIDWLKICPGFDVSTWINSGMMPMEGHIYA